MAKFRLILLLPNDPRVQGKIKKGLKATKNFLLAVFGTRLVVVLMLVILPISVNASLFSFLSGLFGTPSQALTVNTETNSQTIPLLQATINADATSAQGGGDITIVGGTALLPEAGPSGTMADIGNSSDAAGHISVYVVRQGDTLSQIAKMFGVSVNTIVWNNDIKGGLINEGQTLIILPISGVQHTIKKGDTIKSIAKLYRGDVDEIMKYNGITDNSELVVGNTIIIPDGEVAPSVGSSNYPTSRLRGAGGPDYGQYYLIPLIHGVKSQGLHGYNAVDLATSYGSPILATANGQVIVAMSGGWNGGYGSYVVVEHPNNTQTLYAHMSDMIVYQGQYVVRGQVIGYVGSTGKSTGPHLHIEVRGARNPFQDLSSF